MSEKNILKTIKELGYTQEEALELLKENKKEEKGDSPDSVSYTVKKNMFEVDT